MGSNKLLCELFAGLLLTSNILGFNIDTKNVVVIPGPEKTLFGFSAAFMPVDDNSDSLGMIIGAPRGNVINGPDDSGAYHLCENVLDHNEKCTVSKHADDMLSMVGGTVKELFGAALAMTASKNFTVCSPLWKDTDYGDITFTPGRCSIINLEDEDLNDQKRPFFSTSKDARNYLVPIEGKNEYLNGLANFGFSADSDKKSVFVFGAPGVLVSEGSIYITDVATNQASATPIVIGNNHRTTAYGYLGYAVKIGRFCDGSDICIAASAPNRNRIGMVLIYRWENKERLIITEILSGMQAWSNFGYALCAADVNNDKYDELIVGSPYFTDLDDKLEGHDQGRVYVFSRSEQNKRFTLNTTLDGDRKHFARFGFAVQNIGDINLDNFADVVVGAPGENDGDGCIYIYLGSINGLRNSPSQRITAKQISVGLQKPIKGFGFAFSDHAVLSNQKYPVFVATSVASDSVAVFKTRPVVEVNATLKADPDPVDADKTCPGSAGACFKINFCLNYNLREFPIQKLTFQVGLDIDVQVTSNLKRALIRTASGQMMESISNQSITSNGQCLSYTAVLRENQVGQDRFTPVQIVATYSIIEDTTSEISPVLDGTKYNNVSIAVAFVNKCGDDNECDVDLSINASLTYKDPRKWNYIVVNSTEELQVELEIKNSQEPSYWTVIKVEVDSPLRFTYASSVAISCDQQNTVLDATKDGSSAVATGQEKTMVLCSYYRPLNQGDTLGVRIFFNTQHMQQLTQKTLKITSEVMAKNKNSQEQNPGNNNFTLTTPVYIIANVSISGFSSPSEFTIHETKTISSKETTDSKVDFRQTGKEIKHANVTHRILIRNLGPSFLPDTKVKISVPVYLLDRTQLIHEAVVKIAAADGTVSDCYGTKADFLGSQSTTQSLTSQTYTTAPPYKDSSDFSASTPDETTTWSFDSGVLNKRRKRAAGCESDQNDTYTLCCDVDDQICQVFECKIGIINPSVVHAEINISLVIDQANIPMPENINEFRFEIKTQVSEPSHPLFKSWSTQPTTKTVTKFYLLQSGGKINIWIIVGCVIAGLVLITIIVIIFWKLGFFKREKHNQVEEWKRASQRKSKQGYSKAPEGDAGETAATSPPDEAN